MKKILFSLLLIGSLSTIKAQNITDAVRYTNQNPIGTARYNAVSGAFGALGGDLSALNNNPASSAIFTESFASVTGTVDSYDNDGYYFNGITSTDDNDFSFNQLGGVFVLNNYNTQSKWKKLSFSVNYDRMQDFDNNYIASGISDNSIADYFLGNAQGFRLADLSVLDGENTDDAYFNIGQDLGYQAQQGFLGYQAFIINPVEDTDDNTNYVSNIANGNFDQEYNYTSTGYNGKINFNVATQYGENLYLGLNLNSHFIDYEVQTLFFEDNDNGGSGINSLTFTNNLEALGNGFSFQLGGIYQASPSWRLGVSYDSPTWFTIEEKTRQSLSSNGDDGVYVVAPDIVNVFERYNLKTPSRATGSIAYIFNNVGFLSFDYSFQDFSNIEYKSNSVSDFNTQNDNISNELAVVSTYRLGGEYRAGAWSFRGGYRFETSPYEDHFSQGDLTSFSAGLGYSFGAARLDIAYSRASQEMNARLYEGDFTNTAFIDQVNSNLTATLSFRL
ncbi:MAG TPA: transporter [Leeuwenhoekiella sp.]|nr:transporter [Leeuwenhoekiella sp.]